MILSKSTSRLLTTQVRDQRHLPVARRMSEEEGSSGDWKFPIRVPLSRGSLQAMMAVPNKETRQKCWDSRDAYWKCLDEGSGERKDREDKCKQLKQAMADLCPAVWVKHFDRRYDYLKYKEQLEKHGYEQPYGVNSQM